MSPIFPTKVPGLSIQFLTMFIRNQFCIFFSGKSSSRNSSRSGFRRYIIFVTSTVSVIVALTFTLGETNAVHVGYGKIIIIQKRILGPFRVIGIF